jgi:DNA-binding NtrC family response regulator
VIGDAEIRMKPTILLVDDEPATQFGFGRYLSRAGYEIQAVSTLAEAREAASSKTYDVVLLDLHLPDGNGLDWVVDLRMQQPNASIVMITGSGDIPAAVESMRRGADQFLTKPVNLKDLEVFLRKGLELETLRHGHAVRRRLARRFEPYFGRSERMKKVVELAQTAAANEATILLRGETGTGKGVLARWMHERSPRSATPFVELNCSSLRGDLLASELFGHVKGAFTSAVQDKQGLIEVAHGATLFLDEIGDMDIAVQAQFLKVIEEKRYRRVGDVRERTSEFRLLCATNHDLEEQCRAGRFRRDLYFRINVFPIEVPPLREMREDIPELSRHLLRSLVGPEAVLPEEVVALLVTYAWPGNIRELRNVLERASLLAHGGPIGPEHFPGIGPGAVSSAVSSVNSTLADVERARIKEVLAQVGGDVARAAVALGISRATLYRRLKAIDGVES